MPKICSQMFRKAEGKMSVEGPRRIWKNNIKINFKMYFLFLKTSTPALGSTQLPIQWVPWLFHGVKGWQRETNHSPTSSAEIKNEWNYV
jgi:hypothetical protein